jgi:hypothetical protein
MWVRDRAHNIPTCGGRWDSSRMAWGFAVIHMRGCFYKLTYAHRRNQASPENHAISKISGILVIKYLTPLTVGHSSLYARSLEFLDESNMCGWMLLSLSQYDTANMTRQSSAKANVITLRMKPGAPAAHPPPCYRSLQADLLHHVTGHCRPTSSMLPVTAGRPPPCYRSLQADFLHRVTGHCRLTSSMLPATAGRPPPLCYRWRQVDLHCVTGHCRPTSSTVLPVTAGRHSPYWISKFYLVFSFRAMSWITLFDGAATWKQLLTALRHCLNCSVTQYRRMGTTTLLGHVHLPRNTRNHRMR